MQEVHIKRFWEQLGDGQLPSSQLEERLLQALKVLSAKTFPSTQILSAMLNGVVLSPGLRSEFCIHLPSALPVTMQSNTPSLYRC